MIKMMATGLWEFSEWTGIPLGPFAPYVFGLMIGCWPHRVRKPPDRV